jgi:hypothetical protein
MPDLMPDRNVNQTRDIFPPPNNERAPERFQEEETSAEVLGGGSLVEAICGIGAMVLAIVAFAGILPNYLSIIAAIVVGGGLLLEGGAIGMRFSRAPGS